MTAYHEAGHALVALSVPKSDPLHKVTIIPRGRALGVTMSLPERDKYGYSKVELTSKLAMMFGGRVAEELIFGAENVTTGAGNDIQQATGMARRMVTEWGFSEKLGPLRYSANEEEVFLGHSVTQQKNMSDQTADLIDSEVRSLIEDAEATARQVLEERKKDLELLAQAFSMRALRRRHRRVIRGEDITRPTESDTPTDEGRRASVPTSGRKKRGRNEPDGMEPEPQPGT